MSSPGCGVPNLAQIGSNAYVDRLAATRGPQGAFPLLGSFDLTQRCNLHCRHCYARYPGAADGELGFDRAAELLDLLCEAGMLFLTLTGGEPLRREDFADLYGHAKARGFLVTLFTNGTLLDASVADLLAAAPPYRVELTVYGHTRETYEKVTRVPGSFDRFREGVVLLRERRLALRLKMMVLRSNAHELRAVRDWAASLEIPFRHDAIVNPRLDGDRTTAAEQVPAETVAALEPADAGARTRWKRRRRERGPQDARRRLFGCGAGIHALHVDARGLLHPCMMWRQDPFDPFREPPREGWAPHAAALRERRLPPDSACGGCANLANCPQCPALSRLETGTAGKPVPFFCAVTEARERRLLMTPSEGNVATNQRETRT
jgi:MoaA/NifB/PqqE/SkfB family radical SAM enzyme